MIVCIQYNISQNIAIYRNTIIAQYCTYSKTNSANEANEIDDEKTIEQISIQNKGRPPKVSGDHKYVNTVVQTQL
jgi:hypothetical protein